MSLDTTLLCLTSATLGLPLLLSYLAQRSRKRQKPSAFVKKLWIYPIKSCGGMEIEEARCTPMGLEFDGLIDRSFCIYGDDGHTRRMLSLKVAPSMSLIRPRVKDGILTISAPGLHDLNLPYNSGQFLHKPHLTVKNGREFQSVVDCGDEAASWVSSALKQDRLRLGYSGFYLRDKMTNIFSQQEMYGLQLLSEFCAPLHLVSEASLTDLRQRLEDEVVIPDNQFRQPILVTGCQAFHEDSWYDIHIGTSRLYNVQPCSRCMIITNNPDTGKRNTGMEPLNTLKNYRMQNGSDGPVFGIKVGLLKADGAITVGDAVYTTPHHG